MQVMFNRNPATIGRSIEQPPQDLVKATPSLWQADLDTALAYGGELTRAALGAMEIRGDKKHVLVDTSFPSRSAASTATPMSDALTDPVTVAARAAYTLLRR